MHHLENVLLCLKYENNPIKSTCHVTDVQIVFRNALYSTKIELKLKEFESESTMLFKKLCFV